MDLQSKGLAGLVRKQEHIDYRLRCQGFTCPDARGGVYKISLYDPFMKKKYWLRIPTTPYSEESAWLRLGYPSMDLPPTFIPQGITETANYLLAEVASYLRAYPAPTIPSTPY